MRADTRGVSGAVEYLFLLYGRVGSLCFRGCGRITAHSTLPDCESGRLTVQLLNTPMEAHRTYFEIDAI